MLKVATNDLEPNKVHSIDEHGLCSRSVRDLIFHAANRHASRAHATVPFFFDWGQPEQEEPRRG